MNRPDLTRAVGLSFMAVLFLGLVLDGYFLTSFYQGRPLIRETLLHARPRWGLSDALQVIVFLFFAEACIASAEIVLGLFFNLKKTGHDFFLLLNSLLRDLAAAAFIFYLVKKKFKTGLSQIGLSFESFFVNVKRGLTGYAAMLPPLIALLFILAFLAKIFSYEPMPQEVVQVYLRKSTDNYILPLSLFVTVLGPVIEEIFFRGFTYKAFRKQFGVLWAAIATAAVFAAFHMNLMAFLPIFFLGLFFAYLYEKTGSLVPSITAHVTHNLLMVFLTLGFKSLSG